MTIKQTMSSPINKDPGGVAGIVNEASDGIKAIPAEIVLKAADDSTFSQVSHANPLPVSGTMQLTGSYLKQTVVSQYPATNISVLAGATVIILPDHNTNLETDEWAYVFYEGGVSAPQTDVKVIASFATVSEGYGAANRGVFYVELPVIRTKDGWCRTDFYGVWGQFLRLAIQNNSAQDMTIRNSVLIEKCPKGAS